MRKYGKVSLIVPVFNSEIYIRRCIESIIMQNYLNIEIVLIDDGSTDSSNDICREYANQDNRIHLICQKNCGVSAARNAGLRACTGEYILFVDADDYLLPGAISQCMEFIKNSHKTIDILVFGVNSPDDKEIKSVYSNWGCLTQDTLEKSFWCSYYPTVWGKVYKKIVWDNVFFPENMNFAEDRYTLAQILKPSYNVQFLDGKYYYYEKENSKSLTKYSSSASSYCDFMAWKQCLHMDIPPLYKRELQKLFQDYCILSALDACMLSKLDHKLGKTEEKEIKLFLQEHDFYESKFVVDRIYYSWKVIEDRYVFMGEIPDIWRIRAIRRAVQVLSLNKFRPFLSRPEIYNIYRFIEEFTDKKYTHIKLAPGQKILLWAYKNKINFILWCEGCRLLKNGE